jgi:hypothetical protein
VEASFLPLAQAIIQTKGVPLARPINADESRQAAFDRCCRVRCVHLGLIHFTVEFAVAGRFEHAGFHSAKALLSKTSNGFFIWGFVTNESTPGSTRKYGYNRRAIGDAYS